MGRRDWLAPLAAAAGAGAFGIVGTMVRRPWHDELYTLELARRPVSAILQSLHLDSGPPGYYLVCHLLELFGADSVRALRLLSVVAVMAAAALVASCRHTRVRWAAAALVGCHPLVLAAAADARPYALLMAVSSGVLFVLTREPSRTTTAVLALLLASACWIHSLGLILTAAVFATGLLLGEKPRRRALVGTLTALLLQLPWLPVMMRQPAASLQWMSKGWDALPTWWRLLLPLTQPGPAALRTPFLDLASPPLVLAISGTVLWLVLAALGAFSSEKARTAAGVWLAAGALLVLGTTVLRPIYAPDQADKILLVFAVFVVAAAAVRSRAALAGALALALVGGGASATTLHSWKTSPPRPEERAARAILSRAGPGDVVIATGWWFLGVRHGLGATARRIHWITFPRETATHPGWYDDRPALAASLEIPALERRIALALRRGHRVFLIRSPSLPSNRLLDDLAGRTGLVPVAAEPPYWQLWEGRPPTRRDKQRLRPDAARESNTPLPKGHTPGTRGTISSSNSGT